MLEIRNETLLQALAGGALLWVAARGSWILRVGAAASGASLLYAAYESATEPREPRLLTEPAAVETGEEARVDQSSWESFPASDPPGY